MTATIYWSRVMGVALLAAAAVMLAARPAATAFAVIIAGDRRALIAVGVFRVLAGGAVVLTHNEWRRGFWPLVVTLCGWLILLRGVAGLFLPRDVFNSAVGGVYVPEFYYLYAGIPLVLGAYLGLRGFSASAKPPEPRAPSGSA